MHLVNLILLVIKEGKPLIITDFKRNEKAPKPRALSLGASQKACALFCEPPLEHRRMPEMAFQNTAHSLESKKP